MTTLAQSIKEYEAFVARKASPEAVARIAAKLRDPNSDLRQWFRKCAEIRRERRRRNDLLPLPPLDDSGETSPPAEPLAVPSTVVAEQARPGRRSTAGRRWRTATLAALALLAVLATAGGTYAGVRYVQKRNRSSEVLALVASAREHIKQLKREEALRVFGQADNLATSPVNDEARASLESLRGEIGLLRSLSDLYITSNREWLDHAGIKRVSDAYLEFFTEAGILGGGRDPQQQATAIRALPDVASYLIAGIDHWLSVLYLLPAPKGAAEAAERTRLDALIKELQEVAIAADATEPSKTVRGFIAREDLDGLDAYFTKNKTTGLHPETVGQVTGFLLSRGRTQQAFFAANDAWWSHPNNATINGVLEKLYAVGVPPGKPDPQESLHFSTLRLASDPQNGVFWANVSIAYRAAGNTDAANHALTKAFELKPDLPLPKP